MSKFSVGSISEFNPSEEDIGAYLLRLKHFFKANNVKADNQVSVLITVIGPKIIAVLSDLLSPDEVDSKTYDELAELLKSHYSPKKLVVAERYLFYSRSQKPGESITEFIVAIKHLASTCKFGTFLKDALRDKLVSGIANDNIRQKLLSEEKDFDDTLALAIRLEQAELQSNIFVQSNHNGEIAKFHTRPRSTSKYFVQNQRSFQDNKCWRCGATNHEATECSYASYKCNVCKKIGHLMKMCKARKPPPNPKWKNAKSKNEVHQLEQEVEEEGLENTEIGLYNVQVGLVNIKSDSGYKVSLSINNVPLSLEIDTGSALTICPEEIFNKHFPQVELKPANVKLTTYSGHNVHVQGQANVQVKYKDQKVNLPLVVVKLENKNQPMLLGRNWLKEIKLDWKNIFQCKATEVKKPARNEDTKIKPSLNLDRPIDIVNLKNKFKSVFEPGTGEIKGMKAHIVLKEGTVPKFCKFRPVPFALREKVDEELDRMVREGIAYKVANSQWSTPLVVVPKPNGNVRLCADFKVTLNQCIENEHYPLPQAQDIFASLAGCSVFSCLDLSNAYQQLLVAEDSQHLLTLATHRGLFRLRRLPFGLSSSPAIFQSVIDQILCGLPGTVAYLDDVLIAAHSKEEALRRLYMVLQRLEEYGVKVNVSKCKFLQNSIEYLGHVISGEGLRPQEGLLAALRDAPEPTNKDEVRAYLGLINYYHAFIPNLSARLSCFYNLLHKDVPWNWTSDCSKTFKESKSWVLDSNLLVHYDVNKPIVLTCDASPRGVAAVLSHLIDGQERPIAFASKTLSSSERNYSQLHREALALIFGVKKFHKYIYGRSCILQTDHQPLTAIFGSKKGVPSMAAARLQRWALILSAYNLEVKYRKAADVPHADALSRLPLPDVESVELEANYVSHAEYCVMFMNNFCMENEIPPITSTDIGRMTERDPLLSKVKDYVLHGWKNSHDPELSSFLNKKDELSVDQNCLLWGSRVVIPKKLHESVLRLLHDQHPGITRMKLLARSYVWWPGLEKSIEDLVSSCQICQRTRNAVSKVPLQQWPMATCRWQRVHIDYAEDPESRQQLLVVIDSYSKWLEVFPMNSTTSSKTIERLRTLFSSFGLPEELVSDNATCFTSWEFKTFLQKNDIKLTLTPPYHPASNGAAERSVQEVKKNLIRQVLEEHGRSKVTTLQHKLDNFLFSYRNTPSSVTGQTPAELFLNWKPRTKLVLLKPNLQNSLLEKRRMQKEAVDRHRGQERNFAEGQEVFVKTVRNEKISWVPGKVVLQRSPVTYLVKVLGRTRFCHADHLRSKFLNQEEDENSNKAIVQTQTPTFMHHAPEGTQENSSSQFQERNASSLRPEVVRGSSTLPFLRRSVRTIHKPDKLDL